MPTVGEILRAEREKQGLSIKDIEKETSIRALYIQAIEEGNYKVLPGEVYLKGFIRNYAGFLGLDPQKMMEVYRENLSPQATPVTPPATSPSMPLVQTPANPPTSTAASRPARGKDAPRRGSGGTGWVFTVIIVLLVIGGGIWAAMTYMNPASPTPPAPQSAAPAPQAPAPTPAPQPTPQPAKPQPPAKPIVINAKYTAQCWTLVTADGKEIYEGIPKGGDTFTWNADQSLTIHLGNAAGVDITYNGQAQSKLGGDGDVIEKTYTAPKTTPQPKQP